MDAEWITSPTARRVLEHWADVRPAWLWSADGQTLLWRNAAARAFPGKGRKGSRAGQEAVPLKGHVPRLVRLGGLGRSSLSRVQFLAGEKAVSATCACTPFMLPDGSAALLIVGVDPVPAETLSLGGDRLTDALFPGSQTYLLLRADGEIAAGSEDALRAFAPAIAAGGALRTGDDGCGSLRRGDSDFAFRRLTAGPDGTTLLVFDSPAPLAPVVAEAAAPEPAATPNGPAAEPSAALEPLAPAEPLLPMGLPPAAAAEPVGATVMSEAEEHWVEPLREPLPPRGLTSLFDRLAEDEALYTPLRADEDFAGVSPSTIDLRAEATAEPEPTALPEAGAPAPSLEAAPAVPEAPQLYRVIARRFTPSEPLAETPPGEPVALPTGEDVIAALVADADTAAPSSPEPEPAAATPAPVSEDGAETPPAPDADSVERVSRYNFDELSRILADRVGNERMPDTVRSLPAALGRAASLPSATPEGALVTLGGETLVLNRLPLGILVFRDQQVLFANRAITEMTGYGSVEALRQAGLSAIFPAADATAPEAGPVNHLVQRDGTLVPVTARLQSVSWQGKPALMLSASTTEVRTGHEAAVRAFAETLAEARGDGFIEATRSGTISAASGRARLLLGADHDLAGRPLAAITAPDEGPTLKAFLERPARFAETARPALTLPGVDAGTEIMLFAQGQAGVVTGYFGFVRRNAGAAPALPAPIDADPGLLGRLSRGVRRPLNTVIGFSDLIATTAFGPIENARYVDYARDIKAAGLEITALIDELDDFARLRDGRYAVRPGDIDLAVLLDSSVRRVRTQANTARVLVRSAVSERLPHVRADRASLAQALLNLLASAIDHSPQDGSVVLSAQINEAGAVVINVRDSATGAIDLGERFVVFRDGVGRDGQPIGPVRSSVGLALTRALLAVNNAALTVEAAGGGGTLFSLTIPAENVLAQAALPAR